MSKMKRIYHSLLKYVNGYHKYLKFFDCQDNKFEVLNMAAALDNSDLTCTNMLKVKPTVSSSG